MVSILPNHPVFSVPNRPTIVRISVTLIIIIIIIIYFRRQNWKQKAFGIR